MPVYRYRCPSCGFEDEVHLPIDGDHERACAFCLDETRKVYSVSAVFAEGGFTENTRHGFETEETYRKRRAEGLRRSGLDPKNYLIGDPEKGIPVG